MLDIKFKYKKTSCLVTQTGCFNIIKLKRLFYISRSFTHLSGIVDF